MTTVSHSIIISSLVFIRGFMVNALNLLVGSNVKYKFIAEIPNAEIPKYP